MKRILLTLGLSLAVSLLSAASESSRPLATGQSGPSRPVSAGRRWYAGVGAGVPFGVSTLSSFGSDGLGSGWSAGAHLGRALTPVTSAEVSVSGGRVSLSARDCCVSRGYWLGSDGTRYNAPVVDMEGWGYADLRSSVSIVRLDARVNVNVLGLVDRLKGSPWAFEVSPSVSVVMVNSNLFIINTQNTRESVRDGQPGWALGAGARLQLRRRLGGRTSVSAYSGLTCLSGKRIDGAPAHQHRANMLVENGLRLSWTFGGGQD